MVEAAFDAADRSPSRGEALLAVARALGHFQLTAEAPLLRIGSYQILPDELRRQMMQRSVQLTRRVAGMICDGIADGSIRHCDPLIAGHYFLATVYGLSDMRDWSAERDAPRLVDTLVKALHLGAI